MRFAPVVASARDLPASTCGATVDGTPIYMSMRPPRRSVIAGTAALVRNVEHLDASALLEELAGEMPGAAHAG